jgi:capsular polysaccharide biosynthesis protein
VKAADWTNRYVQLLNDEMRARATADAEASLGYLQNEFATTADVSTREAISKLIESQVKQKMLAHVTQEYALRVIDKAEVADADAPVRPVKILFLALGIVFGAILGIAVALLLYKRELSKRGRSTRQT